MNLRFLYQYVTDDNIKMGNYASKKSTVHAVKQSTDVDQEIRRIIYAMSTDLSICSSTIMNSVHLPKEEICLPIQSMWKTTQSAAHGGFTVTQTSDQPATVTIIAGQKQFLCNRGLLVSNSDYFKTIFETDMQEKHTGHVNLDTIDAESFEIIYNFMSLGYTKFKSEQLYSVMYAVEYLLIDRLANALIDAVSTRVVRRDVTESVDLFLAADTFHSFQKLRQQAFTKLCWDFTRLIESEELYHLPREVLQELVSSPRLNVSSELDIFTAIIMWTDHEPATRRSFLNGLLQHVRLPLINIGDRVKIIKPILSRFEISLDALESDGIYEAQVDKCAVAMRRKPDHLSTLMKPRIRMGTERILLAAKICAVNPNIRYSSVKWFLVDPRAGMADDGLFLTDFKELENMQSLDTISVVGDGKVIYTRDYKSAPHIHVINLETRERSTIPCPHPRTSSREASLKGISKSSKKNNEVLLLGLLDNCLFALVIEKLFGKSLTLYSCNLETKEWQFRSILSTTHCFDEPSGIFYGGLLYIFTYITKDRRVAGPVNHFEVHAFDPRTDVCSMRSYPEPLKPLTVVGMADRWIYLVPTFGHDCVYRYNTVNWDVSKVTDSMPCDHEGINDITRAIFVIECRLLCAFIEAGHERMNLCAYLLVNEHWTEILQMPLNIGITIPDNCKKLVEVQLKGFCI
ncbi:uncharacterized protein LOC117110251 [Anneissia japonica]|uniref:uncharacterized protein LOC117110251 n=1 Tax=Anneissia japonica TaxID=1529436 RepID=UPI001425A118|nr:uncharacterized protein LOC117110251 [Anneissia japonica]